jgi:hypothetical protein
VAATAIGWQVVAGDPVTASTLDPPGGVYGLGFGARIEVPVTRAIVSPYELAAFNSGNGTWTVTLDPVINPGAYLFVWRTDDAEPPFYEAYIPIDVNPTSGSSGGTGGGSGGTFPLVSDHRDDITPSTDDVAQLERTRIVEPGGQDPGVFTTTTHPTVPEVDYLIQQAVDDILLQVPDSFDPSHYEQVKNIITLYAATLVEASYFREQLDEGSVELYRSMYRDMLTSLNARLTTDQRDADVEGWEGAILH